MRVHTTQMILCPHLSRQTFWVCSISEVTLELPQWAQKMTCILKCFCRVLLCFIPTFSLHFDFIIWTYCMSRCRCWMAPPAGHQRNTTFRRAETWRVLPGHG